VGQEDGVREVRAYSEPLLGFFVMRIRATSVSVWLRILLVPLGSWPPVSTSQEHEALSCEGILRRCEDDLRTSTKESLWIIYM
jgi:hypothetical protein